MVKSNNGSVFNKIEKGRIKLKSLEVYFKVPIIILLFLTLSLPLYVFILPGTSYFSLTLKTIGFAVSIFLFISLYILMILNNKKQNRKNNILFDILSMITMLSYSLAMLLNAWGKNYIIVAFLTVVLFFCIFLYDFVRTMKSVANKSNKVFEDKAISYIFVIAILSLSLYLSSIISTNVSTSTISLFKNITISLITLVILAHSINSITKISLNKQKGKSIIGGVLLGISTIILYAITMFRWFDKELAIGILTISGGVIGGVLTLSGVYLTINQQKKNRDLDKTEERKPYLKAEEQSNLQRPNIAIINEDKEVNKIKAFGIKTLTGAYGIIDKFIINDEDYLIKSKKFIDDIGCNVEDIYINKNETLKSAYIVVTDLAQKGYKYEMFFNEGEFFERIYDSDSGHQVKFNKENLIVKENVIGINYFITEIGLPKPYKEPQ